MNKKKQRKKRKRKPFSLDEKTVLGCSFFASMLFLFSNFQSQQTLLDVLILVSVTMSLLLCPFFILIRWIDTH